MVYKNFLLRSVFSILFVLVYLFISYLNFTYVFYLVLLIYFFLTFEIIIYFKKFKLIPIIYIFTSLIFFFLIEFDQQIILSFNVFIFTIISFDILCYLIGKIFGKKPLIKISPNKTVEGFLGGLFFSLIFSHFYLYYKGIELNLKFFLFIILIILTAFIGDLIESYFKRKNNLKNSSEFIPGHGGVFDRFDSFLFSIIFYSISINFLI